MSYFQFGPSLKREEKICACEAQIVDFLSCESFQLRYSIQSIQVMPATSSLAAQLAKLSGGAQGYLLQKNKPSLLFDKKQAAHMDKDSLLSLARTGLEDLISQNQAFKEFEVTLFSDKFKELKRSLMVRL